MKVPTCTTCRAALAPAEAPSCIRCSKSPCITIGDRAVRILERTPVPLPYWDIQREMDRDAPRPVHPGSLLVSLSKDARICWAGKGVYGLFRHGLVQNARGLGSVAEVHVLAASIRLDLDQLHFVLRHQGYRCQQSSLAGALQREIGYDWSQFVGPRTSEYGRLQRERRLAQLLGFRRRSEYFEGYRAAIGRRVSEALRERNRRLRDFAEPIWSSRDLDSQVNQLRAPLRSASSTNAPTTS